MGSRLRDAVVFGVLVAGGITATAVWHPLGRWAALLTAVLAVVIAAVAYRLRPSAFAWRDDEAEVQQQRRQHAEP